MGLELMSLSAKVDAENRVWLDGVTKQFAIRVSISALVNSIVTYVRCKAMSGEINLNEIVMQSMPRVSRGPSVSGTPATPGTPVLQLRPVGR